MTILQLTAEDVALAPMETTVRGDVPIVISLSAYDIPTAITIDHDERTGRLKISFQYVTKDEPDERRVDDHLSVIMGARSGKVLGFSVDPKYRARDLSVRIVEGVEEQMKSATRQNQILNYRLIKRIIERRLEPELLKT